MKLDLGGEDKILWKSFLSIPLGKQKMFSAGNSKDVKTEDDVTQNSSAKVIKWRLRLHRWCDFICYHDCRVHKASVCLVPFYRWESQWSQRFCSLPKDTQLRLTEMKHEALLPHPLPRGFESQNKSALLLRSFSFILRKQHSGLILSNSTLKAHRIFRVGRWSSDEVVTFPAGLEERPFSLLLLWFLTGIFSRPYF